MEGLFHTTQAKFNSAQNRLLHMTEEEDGLREELDAIRQTEHKEDYETYFEAERIRIRDNSIEEIRKTNQPFDPDDENNDDQDEDAAKYQDLINDGIVNIMTQDTFKDLQDTTRKNIHDKDRELRVLVRSREIR